LKNLGVSLALLTQPTPGTLHPTLRLLPCRLLPFGEARAVTILRKGRGIE